MAIVIHVKDEVSMLLKFTMYISVSLLKVVLYNL